MRRRDRDECVYGAQRGSQYADRTGSDRLQYLCRPRGHEITRLCFGRLRPIMARRHDNVVERIVATLAIRQVDGQLYFIRQQLDVADAVARFDLYRMALRSADFDQLTELRLQKFAKDDTWVEFPLSDRCPLHVQPL